MPRLITLALLLAPVSAPVFGQNLSGYCLDMREEGCMPRYIPFAGNTIDFCEESCQLTAPTEVRGMDATLYDLQCSGDYGEIPDMRVMLLTQESPMSGQQSYWIGPQDIFQIVPCP